MTEDLRPATIAVTAGRPAHEPDQPLNHPITMAATYVAGGDVEYGRYGNPTWTAFEDALGALEGGRCLAFSTGMAAVSAVLDLVGQGAKVVLPRHAYQGTIMALAVAPPSLNQSNSLDGEAAPRAPSRLIVVMVNTSLSVVFLTAQIEEFSSFLNGLDFNCPKDGVCPFSSSLSPLLAFA